MFRKIIALVILFSFINNGTFLLLVYFNPESIDGEKITQVSINTAIIAFCLWGVNMKYALNELLFKYFRKRTHPKEDDTKEDDINLRKNEQFELQTVKMLNLIINMCKENDSRLKECIENIKKLTSPKFKIDFEKQNELFNIDNLTRREYNFLLVMLKSSIIDSKYKFQLEEGEEVFYSYIRGIFIMRIFKECKDEKYSEFKKEMDDLINEGIIHKENSYGKTL